MTRRKAFEKARRTGEEVDYRLRRGGRVLEYGTAFPCGCIRFNERNEHTVRTVYGHCHKHAVDYFDRKRGS